MGDWQPDPNRAGRWLFDPAAPTPDPTVTQMMPVVAARPVDYDELRDWPAPAHLTDIGDHVSRTAPDPTPDEVVDPDNPSFVEPFTKAP